MTVQLEGPARMIGLWVKEAWWHKAGRIPLPRSPMAAMHVLEPRRAICPAL